MQSITRMIKTINDLDAVLIALEAHPTGVRRIVLRLAKRWHERHIAAFTVRG